MLGSTVAAALLALAAATAPAPAPGAQHDAVPTIAVPGRADGQAATVLTTTTAVTVWAEPQGASRVTVTVAGAAGTGAPAGTVALYADGAPVAVLPLDDGAASLTTTTLDPGVGHRLSARYVPTDAHAGSASPPVDLAGPGAAAVTGTVTLTIPAGLLSITSDAEQVVRLTGFGPAGPGPTSGTARVVVTDTRAGDLGFSVSAAVVAGSRSGTVRLVDVRAEQVPGNGLAASDLVTARSGLPHGRGPSAAVATYPAGRGTGSVVVNADVVASGLPRGVTTVRVLWTVM